MDWLLGPKKTERYGLSNEQLQRILTYAPIEPVYGNPESFDASPIASLVTDDDRAFFVDFSQYGRIFNATLLADTCWRLQERNDSYLILSDSDDPEYGRCYDVYHNSYAIGRLEISPGIDIWSSDAISRYCDRQFVNVHLSIRTPLAIPFSSIAVLLTLIPQITASADAASAAGHSLNASHAIQGVLWDALQLDRHDLPLSISWQGHPAAYLRMREVYSAQRKGHPSSTP